MPVAAPTFAECLRWQLAQAGITQYQLAKRTGLTRQSISRLVRGDVEPSWDSVKRIARALGVPVGAFDVKDEPVVPEPPPPPTPPRRFKKK